MHLGTLNCCSLNTLRPVLQQAADADPESPAAHVPREIAGRRLELNAGLARKNGRSEETRASLRKTWQSTAIPRLWFALVSAGKSMSAASLEADSADRGC